MDAVVLAAGEGRRLRPLTERWAKPVLPIGGRAILGVLLQEIARSGFSRVWLVTGHLADQVERLVGNGSSFDLDIRYVSQPDVLGSADAVRRALVAGAQTPVLVSAADTVYRSGDVGWFAETFAASGADGAVAVRTDPAPSSHRRAVRQVNGRVDLIHDLDPSNPWSAAPLWGIGDAVAERLCLDEPPHELANAFQAAIDASATVIAVEIGKTRDLTDPLDLVEENFPYLRSL